MDAAIGEWREQVLAHERDIAALHGDRHGHGGHGCFGFVNRPLDLYRTDDPVLNSLFAILEQDATVLDVGGGAGRFALPLATRARRVTVVEPSADAVEMLKTRAAEAGLANLTVINAAWEDAEAPASDLVLCSLTLHHVPDAAPFIARLQAHATDRVVVVEMMETPGAIEVPFYQRVHGAAPAPLPGLPYLLRLLWAMDIYPDVKMLDAKTAVLDTDRHAALEHLERRLGIAEGTEAYERFRVAADELLVETPEGFTVRGVAPSRQAIVTWKPVPAST